MAQAQVLSSNVSRTVMGPGQEHSQYAEATEEYQD